MSNDDDDKSQIPKTLNNPHIVTVLGEIPSRELGFCHSHEHLSIAKGQSFHVNPALCIDVTRLTLEEVVSFRSVGGNAIVDAQPIGCGREALVLKELSEKSGVHIISSTGFHKLCFYPQGHWIFSCSLRELSRIFIEELTLGMYSESYEAPATQLPGCRAGLIKTALDSGAFGADELYCKLFSAAALAAKETGFPLMVHIEFGADPVGLADFLEENNVPLNKVIFCHMDRAVPDLSVHKKLCARGIYMEYDTIGRIKYHSDRFEAEIVKEMVFAGYENRLLMGLDVTRERMESYGGSVGLTYIKKVFIPLLKECNGIDDGIIDKFFVENPALAFSVY